MKRRAFLAAAATVSATGCLTPTGADVTVPDDVYAHVKPGTRVSKIDFLRFQTEWITETKNWDVYVELRSPEIGDTWPITIAAYHQESGLAFDTLFEDGQRSRLVLSTSWEPLLGAYDLVLFGFNESRGQMLAFDRTELVVSESEVWPFDGTAPGGAG